MRQRAAITHRIRSKAKGGGSKQTETISTIKMMDTSDDKRNSISSGKVQSSKMFVDVEQPTDDELKRFKDLCMTGFADEKQLSITLDKMTSIDVKQMSSKIANIILHTGLVDRMVKLIQTFTRASSIVKNVTDLTRLVDLLKGLSYPKGIDCAVYAAGGFRVAIAMLKMNFHVPVCLNLIGNIMCDAFVACDKDAIDVIYNACLSVKDRKDDVEDVAFVMESLMSNVGSIGDAIVSDIDRFIDMLLEIIDRKVNIGSCHYALRALGFIAEFDGTTQALIARPDLVNKIANLFPLPDKVKGDIATKMLNLAVEIICSVTLSSDRKHIETIVECKSVIPLIKMAVTDTDTISIHRVIANLAMEHMAIRRWIVDNGFFPIIPSLNPKVLNEQLYILSNFCETEKIDEDDVTDCRNLFLAQGGLKMLIELIKINDRQKFASSELVTQAKEHVKALVQVIDSDDLIKLL